MICHGSNGTRISDAIVPVASNMSKALDKNAAAMLQSPLVACVQSPINICAVPTYHTNTQHCASLSKNMYAMAKTQAGHFEISRRIAEMMNHSAVFRCLWPTENQCAKREKS